MATFIIILILVGLVAGAVARLVVPGRDPMGIFGTIVLGIVGSFVGGFLENLVKYHTLSVHSFHPVGLIGSVTAPSCCCSCSGLPAWNGAAAATDRPADRTPR